MRANAIFNLVFNRKGKVLTPDDTALIQVEILFVDASKMYLNIGTYVKKAQWDPKHRMIINRQDAGVLNKRLTDIIAKLRTAELRMNEQEHHLNRKAVQDVIQEPGLKRNSFVDFMLHEILKRKEIHMATRYRHNLIAEELRKLGIVYFSDLTLQNIQRYDDFLRDHLEQTTVGKKHSNLKTYIYKAIAQDLMTFEQNPYRKFQVTRGKHRIRTRLDDHEMDLMISGAIEDENLNRIRQLYVFMMFTGLAYRDINFTKDQIRKNGKKYILEGLRKKTGEFYSIPLLPPAYEIIKEYGTRDPKGPVFDIPTYEQFKRNLKIVAAGVGITRNITPHSARHTCASMLLRNGTPLSVLMKLLGHSDIRSTLIYSKLDDPTVEREITDAYTSFKNSRKPVKK